ncbi:MAG: hypothetical protein HY830_14050 [Actinobacteria bacterium]|nr:hypothetical protein [Actinomycetota bacterium]
MGRYSASNSKAGVNAANTIMWQLRGGTSERLKILEIGLGVKTAPTTAPAFQLIRTTAVGTSSTTAAGNPYDAGDPTALGTLDSAWSVNPTLGTGAFRETTMTTTAGGQTFWTFYDEPLIVPASATAGLAIVNTVATGATLGTFVSYVVWDE